MGKGEKRFLAAVLLVLAAALAALLLQTARDTDTPRVYHVSVLLDGTDADYLKNFMAGVNQAAQEQNVDVRFVSHYVSPPAQAQAEALQSEWTGETDGVILIPAGGEALSAVLSEAPADMAVTVAGPALPVERAVCYVAPDYAALGTRLAGAVAGSGQASCTVFLPEGHSAAAELIYQELTAHLTEKGFAWEPRQDIPEEGALPASLGTLVAVEPATAEQLCKLSGGAAPVYGVGSSNRLLHYLEDGAAKALVVQSDFDAGYLSLMRTVETLSGLVARNELLESYTVTKENMFESPLADFLFSAS